MVCPDRQGYEALQDPQARIQPCQDLPGRHCRKERLALKVRPGPTCNTGEAKVDPVALGLQGPKGNPGKDGPQVKDGKQGVPGPKGDTPALNNVEIRAIGSPNTFCLRWDPKDGFSGVANLLNCRDASGTPTNNKNWEIVPQ